MARVFISHSSRDPEPAARIKAWLEAQGFDAPFLDFDKHAGIPPGADWERTLYSEIDKSEAIIIIQTPNWLESKWCFAEFTQARALGKPIFPIIETPTGDTLISPDVQTLDLTRDSEGGLMQLSAQLTQIALDAQGGFAWDAQRAPYPGLLAFQEEDAAIYFGRDDDIRRLIERLNARRTQGGAQLVALLGASGSGKSSLMRAGVIPRLKRSGKHWIVLPPMRPQARPMGELARALAVASNRGAEWRAIQESLCAGNVEEVLSDIASDLRMQHTSNEATILIPIDQAEELFSSAKPEEARQFMTVLSRALKPDLPFVAMFSMRSDFLGNLQAAEALTAKFEEFSVGPMKLERIPAIIEGPARVAGLMIDDQMVHAAAMDAQTEDALPLLAFALRELYDTASDDNRLSLEEYQALGDAVLGLTPLENAVRRRADEVLEQASPGAEDLMALRDAFIPAMVRINHQGDYVRHPASMNDLPARAHPLLNKLADARLLIIQREQDGTTRIEVAHEALLRKWPRLKSWLDEAADFLKGRQQMELDRKDWEAAEQAPSALMTGLKLTRARAWLTERPHQLDADERAYIQAGIDAHEAAERRKTRQRRIITAASVAAAVVMGGLSVFAVFQWFQTQRAFAVRAQEQIEFAWNDLASNELSDQGRPPISDGFDCATNLETGFRNIYCDVRRVVSFERLQAISNLQIFKDGPHAQEIDFFSNTSFGHYNPAFLTWLEDYMLPDDPTSHSLLATQIVYDAQIGPLVRAMYHAYLILHEVEPFHTYYLEEYDRLDTIANEQSQRQRGFEWSHRQRHRFEDVKRDYEVQMQLGDGGEDIQEQFRWLSDYLAASVVLDDWYLANTAGGFWVRRSIDGTDAQIFGLVEKVLMTFEPEVITRWEAGGPLR